MEQITKLSEKIISKRNQLGLTQMDVAGLTGLSDATIRFIEKAKEGVSIANWIKVADVLGMELHLLGKKMSAEK
jgi:DNA-binding XRE family transcriptional regulator